MSSITSLSHAPMVSSEKILCCRGQRTQRQALAHLDGDLHELQTSDLGSGSAWPYQRRVTASPMVQSAGATVHSTRRPAAALAHTHIPTSQHALLEANTVRLDPGLVLGMRDDRAVLLHQRSPCMGDAHDHPSSNRRRGQCTAAHRRASLHGQRNLLLCAHRWSCSECALA